MMVRRRGDRGERSDRDDRSKRGDRGSVSIEFAIVMSALLVGFVSLTIYAGRVLRQEGDVRSAAHAAARAASLRNDFGSAVADAQAVGDENLAASGVSCDPQAISIVSDPGQFIPDDTLTIRVVTVRVECTSAGIAWLGDNVYAYEATEVIDVFRSAP
jgi:Flp pilus assembly protein TadG